ncbi:MAG: hypothetical protein IPO71_12875 [Nitrosomonas sp.]|nr:hypothetical protein [Nitrosomonas sp.]
MDTRRLAHADGVLDSFDNSSVPILAVAIIKYTVATLSGCRHPHWWLPQYLSFRYLRGAGIHNMPGNVPASWPCYCALMSPRANGEIIFTAICLYRLSLPP